MKLIDVAGFINVGQIMTRVEAKAISPKDNLTEVKILTPKAISAGKIDLKELTSIRLKQTIDDKKQTKQGDVIIKLSTPYDAALIGPNEERLAYTSFTAVVRDLDKDRLDALFLTAYLNTDYVKELLRLRAGVTSLPVVKIKDIRELELPDVPLAKQKLIGEAYQTCVNKIEILREMQDNEKQIINSIVMSEVKGIYHG